MCSHLNALTRRSSPTQKAMPNLGVRCAQFSHKIGIAFCAAELKRYVSFEAEIRFKCLVKGVKFRSE